MIGIMLFLITGCVEIEVNTKVNESGGGRQTWKFTGTALLSSEIKKQVENNRFFGKSVIRDEFKEGDYILEAAFNFQDVSELRDADRDVRFESKGWIVKTHTYTEVWKRSGQTTGLLAQHARGVVPVTLRVQVELPGTIVETNADWKEGPVARWSVSVSDLVSTKMLVAKSRSWNWIVLIPGSVVLAIAFAGLVIFVYLSTKKARVHLGPSVDCSACGAKVPGGFAFCNFCGSKMNPGS